MYATRLLVLPSALLLTACVGGDGVPTDVVADQDVRGTYAVTWSDKVTIRLEFNGQVQEMTTASDAVITFSDPDEQPLELDLTTFCADPGVTCPSEAWPAQVAIDQDDPTVSADAHVLRAWDAVTPGAVVTGAVDHQTDQLLFGLEGASGSSGDCAALALSLAGGTFAYEVPDDTGVAEALAVGVPWMEGGALGIVDGRVAVGWLGVCAWSGLAVVATLSLETDYVAVRTGDLPVE